MNDWDFEPTALGRDINIGQHIVFSYTAIDGGPVSILGGTVENNNLGQYLISVKVDGVEKIYRRIGMTNIIESAGM